MDIVSLFADANIRDIGATALLTIVVILILTGRLVPKSVADAWKNAYFTEQASGREKEKQITLLASSTTVSARVLDALPLKGGDSDAETTVPKDRRR
ncbi:hypothetical protein [Microbacterium sp. TPD7012]|uniref:hypothetical protein n=1 Tax=Microbacterium sp. TPD7012 TaxID=2171975 RepID=UPI000D50781A|nr:hypothetical protein [Microbacterium sp. TPD7012]PVE94984.1 hypothetical protein DC434_13750 [Microbacterium sp. TPD7012]